MEQKIILIAEADDEVRGHISDELQSSMGAKIIVAKDGVQGYQKARNQKFDVVICEMNLKKLNGSQLIAAIRETKHNENTPILVYTDDLEDAKKQTRGQKGISFVKKPADYKKMVANVDELSKMDISKKKFKLDVDFINPFIDSSMKTLNSLCGVDHIEAQKPYLFDENVDLNIDISGVLAIVSPYFRGSIAISFSDDVYKDVVGKMLEENVADISIDNQDGVAEIINIIFGQTKAVLNQKGYSLERAIPTVSRGHNHTILQDTKIPILLVPFRSELGNFWIQICVKAI